MSLELVRRGIDGRLRAKAAAMLVSIEGSLDRIMMGWLLVAGLMTAARIAFSPVKGMIGAEALLPLILLVLAPFASMVLALRWFADGECQPQPRTRLAVIGKWRSIPLEEARSHRLYGPGGIMVSLLVGMLLNVPVRALEYWASMPPILGPVPHWLTMLHAMMTLDVVLLTSLYTIAFVAALRRVPLFPRFLAATWCVDVLMQLVTARMVAATDLPPQVAGALGTLLEGNLQKAMISIGIWLPYLLLSKRVNLTYRNRVSA